MAWVQADSQCLLPCATQLVGLLDHPTRALVPPTPQEAVLAAGGVQRFVSLSQSMHQLLRLYGVWGLSSIAFRSTPGVQA